MFSRFNGSQTLLLFARQQVRYLPYQIQLVEVTGETNKSYVSDGNFWILM